MRDGYMLFWNEPVISQVGVGSSAGRGFSARTGAAVCTVGTGAGPDARRALSMYIPIRTPRDTRRSGTIT
jgi:hypothetical protein